MSFGRFILAAIAGAAATLWLLFFAATFHSGYDGTGQIHWTGQISGDFTPWYVVVLYAPPIIVALFSYLALRREKRP